MGHVLSNFTEDIATTNFRCINILAIRKNILSSASNEVKIYIFISELVFPDDNLNHVYKNKNYLEFVHINIFDI